MTKDRQRALDFYKELEEWIPTEYTSRFWLTEYTLNIEVVRAKDLTFLKHEWGVLELAANLEIFSMNFLVEKNWDEIEYSFNRGIDTDD